MSHVQSCTDRDKEALVAYLYNECEPAERDRVETHLGMCPRCADEMKAFRAARDSFGAWMPPEPPLGLRIVAERTAAGPAGWRQVVRNPVVGLAAAAGILLGVALSLGGAEVRFDEDAVVLRVGRTRHAPPADLTAGLPAVSWQPDLIALERELRRDLTPVSDSGASPRSATADREALLRQVQGLIAESERRQQRERALWLTEFAQELDMQRRADQQQLQQALGALEGYADYLVRVSR